jgi:hypothetical protein
MRLLIATLLLPTLALAGTGFDGTWKTNIEFLKTTGKPMALLLAGGEYTCVFCNPRYTVPRPASAARSRSFSSRWSGFSACRRASSASSCR